jgi:hypothetical protein
MFTCICVIFSSVTHYVFVRPAKVSLVKNDKTHICAQHVSAASIDVFEKPLVLWSSAYTS